MKSRHLTFSLSLLIAAPAYAESIGGIVLGMSRDDARSILSGHGKVTESPTIERGPGRGGSSMDAGRYSLILCDNAVVMASRTRDGNYVTFAELAHDKQDAIGKSSDANAISASGSSPLSAIYLRWPRPALSQYILSYHKSPFYEIVIEALAVNPDRSCISDIDGK